MTSPSSWNASSCTARALGTNTTAIAIAAMVVHRTSQRLRRLPVGPITFLAMKGLPSSAVGATGVAASLDSIAVHRTCGQDQGRADRYPLQGGAETYGACGSQRFRPRLDAGSAVRGFVEERNRLAAVRDSELLYDSRDVRAYAARLELQALCDVTRRETFRK